MGFYEKTKEGFIVKIRVIPNSFRSQIEGVKDDVLRVRLCSPPLKGKANKELIEILARHLGIAKGNIRILKGEKSRSKLIIVEKVSEKEILSLC